MGIPEDSRIKFSSFTCPETASLDILSVVDLANKFIEFIWKHFIYNKGRIVSYTDPAIMRYSLDMNQ